MAQFLDHRQVGLASSNKGVSESVAAAASCYQLALGKRATTLAKVTKFES